MNKSKKIFVVVGALFIIGVLIIGYDISKKTSFPGSPKKIEESIMPSDEVEKVEDKKDSTEANLEMTTER